MIFSLAVYSAPFSSQASDSAYRFACALISEGHKLHRVFFYRDGVYNASQFLTPPQDEPNLSQDWQQLALKHEIDLVVCVAAALLRGVLDQVEADRHELLTHNMAHHFDITGLGQLFDAALSSDRLVLPGA